MKKLIFSFLILLFAVWLGFMIHRDPGYILVTYENWSLETSLWVGIAAIVILFFIFHLLLRFFTHASQLTVNLQIWNKERRERKAGEQTNRAFEHLIEMQWESAERLFYKAADDSNCPIINYSAAAYAAQQLFAFDRRNKYLSKLNKKIHDADKASKLIESYFYIHSDQWKEALNTLQLLQKKYPHDPIVLRFLAKTYEGLGNWDGLKDLLPNLEKYCDTREFKSLENEIYTKLLRRAQHPEWLDQVWDEVPKILKSDTEIVEAYAQKAKELRRDNEAVHIIENAIKKNFEPRLVQCYGELKSDQIHKQIHHAETWLKKHSNDAVLLVCLGKLCIAEKLWGKALDYLNQALNIHATPEVHYELGRLYEATDDISAAFKHYRQAASTY